jgi:hypothetical protein
VLRRTSELKRDEVMGGWKKLQNEELHNLFSSPDVIRMMKSRRMRWVGHVACMGAKRNAYRVLVGKPERKRSPGISRRRWENNIKMEHKEMGWSGMGWISLLRDRRQWRALVNTLMNL